MQEVCALPASRPDLLEDPDHRRQVGHAAAAGDRQAIDALCRHCRAVVEAMVFTHARTLTWVEHEDAVQEALIAAVDRFDTFRGEADPCTWMGAVAKNVARNHRRSAERQRARSAAPTATPVAAPHAAPGAHQQFVDLRDWMVRNLTPEYRETFAYFYLEGLSYEEISARQLISVGTVGSRLNRIRRVVAERVGELEL